MSVSANADPELVKQLKTILPHATYDSKEITFDIVIGGYSVFYLSERDMSYSVHGKEMNARFQQLLQASKRLIVAHRNTDGNKFLQLQLRAAAQNVPILPAVDVKQAARLITQLQKVKPFARPPSAAPVDNNAKLVETCCKIPSVGPTQSLALLQHFGSIEAAVNADPQSLSKINRLKPNKVVEFFEG